MQIDGAGETLVSTQASRLARALPFLCRWVPAAAVFCLLSWSVISLKSDFSWDDADPEILNQAWRLANGQSIYRGIDAPPYTFAAYPPLYFALTAILLKLTGLSFLPARLISLLAAVSIGWALVLLNRQWNKTGRGGLWTACLLFLIPAFLYNSTRSNVQMMAVALSVWSLVFFLRNRWKETLILSPLLAVLAFYTKQTQLALPLAMGMFLVLRNRRWLVPYVAAIAAASLIPFLWLQKATGGHFFLNTVRLANLSYDVFQIPQIFLHHAGPILPFIGLALVLCWKRFRNGTWAPVDCYLGCVFAATLFSLGRIGAHGQYVLELLVVVLLYLLRTMGLPTSRAGLPWSRFKFLSFSFTRPCSCFSKKGCGTSPPTGRRQKFMLCLKRSRDRFFLNRGALLCSAAGRSSYSFFTSRPCRAPGFGIRVHF